MSSYQNGNALFIILIAVVLFAALAYAVTKSERQGGNTKNDVTAIAAAGLLEYPSTLKTATLRMMLQGISADEIDFAPPDDPNFSTPPFNTKVFHPLGGNVPYRNIDPSAFISDSNGVSLGEQGFAPIPVGLMPNGSMPGGERFIAAWGSLRKSVCESINEKVTGSRDIPVYSSVITMVELINVYDDTAAAGTPYPFLCVEGSNNPDVYMYYYFF